MLIRDYTKGCKAVSDLHRQLVKALTKGNAFLYMDDLETQAEKKAEAEQYALELIKNQIDTVPVKIKRDMVIQ